MRVFDFHHSVAPAEIDAQQHVHNLRYLQWALWAARDHAAACGWDAPTALSAAQGWVVRSHEVTYRAAALAEDAVVVRTWVSEISRYACTRKFCIYRPADACLLAKGSTRWVFVDLTRHRALEIPAAALRAIHVCSESPPPPWASTEDA